MASRAAPNARGLNNRFAQFKLVLLGMSNGVRKVLHSCILTD